MLAFMPPSPLLPIHTTMASNMSLAILPSAPMAYSEVSEASLPSPAKRPKLSLQTTGVPSSAFGKGSTSLRLETLSATSPTSRNTFSNAYRAPRAPASRQQKPTLRPLATDVPTTKSQTLRDGLESPKASATSSASATSASTIDTTDEVPYKLAYNITSILKNGPLPRKASRRISSFHTRTMFPATKKVSFRAPLTEDIKTSKYTLRHSDVESSTSTISTLELSPSDDQDEATESKERKPKETSQRQSSPAPRAGDKRESPEEEEEDSGSCPATPVAGRSKRRWVWTLDPIESTSGSQTPEQDEDEET